MPLFAQIVHGTRCIVLALALAPAGMAQDGDLAERMFLSGERAYAIQAYPEALETWTQLVQQAPRSPYAAQALLNLARHQVDVERRPEAALPLLERIQAEHLKLPAAAEAMLLRGRILAARSQDPDGMKEVLAEFHRVVDLFPDHPCVQQTRLELGRAYRRLGQWGRALQNDLEAVRLDPQSAVARQALLQGAETLDLMGDTTGCLRMLQSVRDRFPDTVEAAEAGWRIQGRVKARLQKLPLQSRGPWPAGRSKWLKTPTLLATGAEGELYLYQDGLDRAGLLRDGQLVPAGPVVRNARAMLVAAPGQVWLVNGRQGVVRDDPAPAAGPPPLFQNPSGAALDGWGNLWLSDPRFPYLQVQPASGPPRTVPAAGIVALAPLPTGGLVAASDSARTLQFLDDQGRARVTIPYGQGLPAPFRTVVALAADPLGQVAALVDGDFEGVVLWGPDGALLNSASYKALGLSGKFRAIAMDRQGGLILADRANDQLIRVE